MTDTTTELTISAAVVADEQRIHFWPQHFGSIPQWITLEPQIFALDGPSVFRLSRRSIWIIYTLNNEARLWPRKAGETTKINGRCLAAG